MLLPVLLRERDVLMLLALLLLNDSQSTLASGYGPADGCARLAQVVYHAVLHESVSGQMVLLSVHRDDETCADTAATVSRAFTSAMSRLGVSLLWRRGGAFCLTRDVSQCTPVVQSDTTYGVARVASRWRAVQVSVVARLLFDHGVDRSRFTEAGLTRSLNIAFSSVSGRALGSGAFTPEARAPDRKAHITEREGQQDPPRKPSILDR